MADAAQLNRFTFYVEDLEKIVYSRQNLKMEWWNAKKCSHRTFDVRCEQTGVVIAIETKKCFMVECKFSENFNDRNPQHEQER